jgi:hypothetical protein
MLRCSMCKHPGVHAEAFAQGKPSTAHSPPNATAREDLLSKPAKNR